MTSMPQWVRRIVTSPGVRQFGVPAAVMTTIWQAGSERGLHWATFVSWNFGRRLLIALIVTGVLGGLAFEWLTKKMGTWPSGTRGN
jgi:hypothetical protein